MSRHTVSLAALCLRRYACSAPEGDWWHDLCAFVSLVLASKTHETEGHRLRMAEITHECAGNFTAAQGASMEMDMLNNLGWRLHVPTSYELCRHLVDAAYHEHQEECEDVPPCSARCGPAGDLEWQALVADAEACIDASHLWPQEPGCTAAVVAYGAAVAALRRQRHSTGALGAQDALLRRAEHHCLAPSAVNACAERLFSELAVLQAPLARLQISPPTAVSAAEAAAKQKKRRSPTSIADLDTASHANGDDDSEEVAVRSLPIFFPTAPAAPAAVVASGVIHRPAAVRASAPVPVAAAAAPAAVVVSAAGGVIHRPSAVRPVAVAAAAAAPASSSFGDCAGSSSSASAGANGLYKKMKFSESSCFTSVQCTASATATATTTTRAASH
jgi:Cyclin, N-terminal domain